MLCTEVKGCARLQHNTVVRLPVAEPGERWAVVQRLEAEVKEMRQRKAKADAEWVPENAVDPVSDREP